MIASAIVGALIVAGVASLVVYDWRTEMRWRDETRRFWREYEAKMASRGEQRCPHPACGAGVFLVSVTSDGVNTWRCSGCMTEYVQ